MFVAIILQKLHKCIEPNTSRGEFTKKILKLIVTNEKKVDYSSMSSYNRFYDGVTQGTGKEKTIVKDTIGNCALNMKNSLDISEENSDIFPKFKAYLKNLQFRDMAKKDLCDDFRCECPNININNYIDELSGLLFKAIKEAADQKERQKDIDPPIDDSANIREDESASTTANILVDNHSEDKSVNITDTNMTNIYETIGSLETNNNTNYRNNTNNANIPSKDAKELGELKDLIKKLNAHFVKLDDEGLKLCCSSVFCSEEEQNKKEKKFETLRTEFMEENEKIRNYSLSFPELEGIFEEMIYISSVASFRYSFKLSEDKKVLIDNEPYVDEYKKYITQVWKVLSPETIPFCVNVKSIKHLQNTTSTTFSRKSFLELPYKMTKL